jgi:hypothetical protein
LRETRAGRHRPDAGSPPRLRALLVRLQITGTGGCFVRLLKSCKKKVDFHGQKRVRV